MFPTPCPWITSSLSAGPLAGNTYSCSISCTPSTPISASTIYEYRAYAVINGVTYYGNILTGCTCAITTTSPIVNTGCAYCVYDSGMRLSGNSVTDKGGLPIAEYGVLYTQIASYGNSGCMVYDAYPSKMCKKCCSADIATGTCYFTGTVPQVSIIGLSDSTPTYYRAYAKNATGVGYGTIKTQNTCSLTPPTFGVDVEIDWLGGGNPSTSGFEGVYRLYCCNGTLLESCTALPYTKISISSWTVPAGGCYYVNFAGIQARYNGLLVVRDIEWSDNFNSSVSECTCCFGGDNFVVACVTIGGAI